jgi:large subunit ribosomal protein L19
MRRKAIELVESRNVSKETRSSVPEFEAGDTLRVHTKVREGEKEREQVFEGICIRKKHNGSSSTFTVRKISYGVGVERIFPLFSPRIARIEKIGASEVHRARLFFLRELAGKKARLRAREEQQEVAAPSAAPQAQ